MDDDSQNPSVKFQTDISYSKIFWSFLQDLHGTSQRDGHGAFTSYSHPSTIIHSRFSAVTNSSSDSNTYIALFIRVRAHKYGATIATSPSCPRTGDPNHARTKRDDRTSTLSK